MSRPVLLIEDNEDDVFLMKHAWKKAGITHPLHVAEDGQAAIDLLKAALEQNSPLPLPCLILLDLKMPRVPGFEVLQWLQHDSRLRTVPVVVLTSSSAENDVQAAYQYGANSYFSKPASSSELLQLVKLFDEYWLTRCIPPPHCVRPAA